MAQKKLLTCGRQLISNHVAAANQIMRRMFPSQNGLQDTHYLAVKEICKSDPSKLVQIIFINSDTKPVEDDTIVKQVCCMLRCKQSTVNVDVIGVQPQFGGIDFDLVQY